MSGAIEATASIRKDSPGSSEGRCRHIQQHFSMVLIGDIDCCNGRMATCFSDLGLNIGQWRLSAACK